MSKSGRPGLIEEAEPRALPVFALRFNHGNCASPRHHPGHLKKGRRNPGVYWTGFFWINDFVACCLQLALLVVVIDIELDGIICKINQIRELSVPPSLVISLFGLFHYYGF